MPSGSNALALMVCWSCWRAMGMSFEDEIVEDQTGSGRTAWMQIERTATSSLPDAERRGGKGRGLLERELRRSIDGWRAIYHYA